MPVPATAPAGMTARSLYSMLRRLVGAEIIGVADTAGYFTGDTVEEVLAELGAGIGLTDVAAAAATELTIAAGIITAEQTYHKIDTQGDAGTDDLDTINGLADGQFYVFKLEAAARNVVFKHGTGNIINPSGRDITLDVLNDKVFGFSDGTSFFVLDLSLATPANGGLASALAAVTASQGASLIGIQDALTLLTATTVEAALAEIATPNVVATVACADAGGGATTALMSVQLRGLNNGAVLSSARQFLLQIGSVQYNDGPGPGDANISLGTITAGAVISTPIAGGLFLVQTDATGLFACTVTNTADSTRYFSAKTAVGGVSVIGERCTVVGSNSDGATWSA